ncbi:MAG TPA: AsmA family protein, partial [Luteimonas sp.]|nr:AsmA family protein [Luteimonas sp.]
MSSQRSSVRRATDRAAAHPWLTVLAVLCLAILVLVLLWDWNWFKGPIERQVQARTGRALDIGGNLDVDLGRVTVIRAERIRFANAPWAREDTMASADLLELRVEPLTLLFRRELSIPLLRLVKPDVLLETGPEGNNWTFEESGGGAGPRFRRLWIDAGRLRFDDPAGKTSIDIAVASQRGDGPQGSAPIAIEGDGRWRGNPFTLEGRAESPLELTDGT